MPARSSPHAALILATLLLAAGPALAADLDGPPPGYGPRPYAAEPPAPVPGGPGFERQGFERPDFDRPDFERRDFERLGPARPGFGPPRLSAAPPPGCREFVRRRFDADGEPVLRRVRVCDGPDLDRPDLDRPDLDRPDLDRPDRGEAAARGPYGPDRGPPPPPEDIPPHRWGPPRW